eukprot:3753580-Rhodomonas_salina.3
MDATRRGRAHRHRRDPFTSCSRDAHGRRVLRFERIGKIKGEGIVSVGAQILLGCDCQNQCSTLLGPRCSTSCDLIPVWIFAIHDQLRRVLCPTPCQPAQGYRCDNRADRRNGNICPQVRNVDLRTKKGPAFPGAFRMAVDGMMLVTWPDAKLFTEIDTSAASCSWRGLVSSNTHTTSTPSSSPFATSNSKLPVDCVHLALFSNPAGLLNTPSQFVKVKPVLSLVPLLNSPLIVTRMLSDSRKLAASVTVTWLVTSGPELRCPIAAVQNSGLETNNGAAVPVAFSTATRCTWTF